MPFILKETVSRTYLERISATPNAVAFQKKHQNAWKQITFRQFNEECRPVSFGLMALGVRPGDKVAIISNTRYEWVLADLATLGAAAITVPVYASNTPEDVAYILHHSESRVAFVENAKQLEKVLEKRDSLPLLERIIVFDALGLPPGGGREDTMPLEALLELGRREEAKTPTRFEENLLQASPGDLITICYTSGTTGTPKGAMITHDSMMSVLEDCLQIASKHIRPEREVFVSFLPFSHILGKVESMSVWPLGARLCFAENLDKLPATLAEIKPTLMFAVPRIFEKSHNRIRAMVQESSATKQKLFEWAMDCGKAYWAAMWSSEKPSMKTKLDYLAADALVFRKVRDRFGGRLKLAICGGAPLPKEIGEFFHIAGLRVLEGYGLTETCAPVSVNPPEDARFGTVGRPLPEVTIRIADDGEILVKSRKVFKGYYKMPRETEETLQTGWLRTGDIGHIDADGYLHITDRKKDLIITSGGKNIAPQKIEGRAKTFPLISQFVVHGDRRHYLTALVTLERDQVIRYANESQILFSEYSELIRHPKIQALVQKTVDEINSRLAGYETIKKFIILPNEFSVESGELTPSLKVRRSEVARKFKAQLDSMYD